MICINRTSSLNFLIICHVYAEHVFMSKKEDVFMYIRICTTEFVGHVSSTWRVGVNLTSVHIYEVYFCLLKLKRFL